MNLFLSIALISIICFTYRLYRCIFPVSSIDPKRKYVLISGCDTGFGHLLAIELDKIGFNVLAGVYSIENEVKLREVLSSRATVFQLDITQQENIDVVYNLVKTKTDTIHALVNNAGIASLGYIDWITIESIKDIMNVNFFGHVAMTKKFLPLLISKRDSRVVNISSISGFISLPGTSAYTASKYALESFSDCLRREMMPWNLRVSIIEPGPMQTAMTDRLKQSLPRLWATLPINVQEAWGEEFFNDGIERMTNSRLATYFDDPNKVVQAIQHAVISTAPHIRYRPGWQSNFVFFPMSMIPTWLVDVLMSTVVCVAPAGLRKQLAN